MSTLITGNTYPVKEQIKALGGKWNADAKGWTVPDNRAEEARALVASAPAKSSSHAHRGGIYDPQKFNGYGARKGGYRKACRTGGNCSSIGSGRSCGGYDCDGF